MKNNNSNNSIETTKLTPNRVAALEKSERTRKELQAKGILTSTGTIASRGNDTDYARVAKDSIPVLSPSLENEYTVSSEAPQKRVYTDEKPLKVESSKVTVAATVPPTESPEEMEKAFVSAQKTQDLSVPTAKKAVEEAPQEKPSAVLPKVEVATMAQQKKNRQEQQKKSLVVPPALADVWEALGLVEKEKQAESTLAHGARRFSDIEKVEQEWISKRLNMADNALHIFNGASGIGKTTWLCDVASHISSGKGWSWGEECIEGPVILCCPEDVAESTLLTRLEDTGYANLENIIDFSYVEQPQKDQLHPAIKKPFMLPRDFAALSTLISQVKPVAVFVDNVVRCFEKYTSPTFVTPHILNVLTEMAHLQNTAIIVVNHVYDNAKKGGKAASKGASTLESSARVNWLAAPDADNPEWIVISNNNINLARPMAPLRYTRKTVTESVQDEETGLWEERERSFIVYYGDSTDNPVIQEKQEHSLKAEILMLLFDEYLRSVESCTVDKGLARHTIVKSLSKQHSVNAVAACFKRLIDASLVEKTGVGWYRLTEALKNDMLQVAACRKRVAALGIDIDSMPRLNVAALKQIAAKSTP